MSDVGTEDIQSSVLLSTLTSKKKKFKVFLHQNQLIWDRERPPYAQVVVPIEHVLAVSHHQLPVDHPQDDPQLDPHNFIIHYAKRGEKSTWKYCSVSFYHSDAQRISSWVKTIQSHLEAFTNRPKNLLLFINPYGGKKNAMKIYEKLAKPLFMVSGVDVTVNVSQRKDQIRDFVTFHNLDMYDAVACVGGDGTLSELFNGLVRRECRLKQLDFHDINIELPKPAMPVGIIPGGSTDTIAYCVHGTTDIKTAVLQIIFGQRLGMDLVSVYDESKMLRLYASVLSYGYLGDVVHHSDKFRCLGPRRYDLSGVGKIMANKGYEGEIAILTSEDHMTTSKCNENCDECAQHVNPANDTTQADGLVWKTITGRYFMISAANISCACDRSPNGMAPYAHLGDGNMHVVLVKHTSLLNNIRLLLGLSGRRRDLLDLPFVEVHQAKEVCFRAIDNKSKWNCDGEIHHQTDVRAKVRCQLLTVFGSGPPSLTDRSACCPVFS